MKVPLLDLRAQFQTVESELKAAVLEVLASTRYVMGPAVEKLERGYRLKQDRLIPDV